MKLSKTYDPNTYEPNTYALWEKSGAFRPSGKGKPFSTVMPPPNANGNLHIGHALDLGLKDILVRYKRMKGFDTIYIPGADHAGFETWVVYEKELQKQGKSRFDFSREELYGQVWDFVEQQRGNMELQVRALGISASWDDLTFTLDEKVISTVYGTFKKLWDDGLIYRGERIVNYSTKYQTSYADIEVDHRTEKGALWHIAYPALDKIDEIVIATTRPETLFGDVAVAVHPEDERYKHLIGTRVMLPLTGKEIPVIADEYVDPAYGTGAVKITPAHDPNDFEVGKRHNLPRPQVIDFDGHMINVPQEFIGLDVEHARKRTLAALRAEELIRKEETIEHSVGYDYKSGLPIQPLIKEQWFLKIEPLAKRALEAIDGGEITFHPSGKRHILTQYLKNVHDWNLSRQIPWGIPIPAFQNIDDETDWVFDKRVENKEIIVNGATYRREEDTFDTWFSSGQWPFITTDVMTDGDLSRFYPTDLMETGTDLLDRWIARMIMLGLYATDRVPFKDVYLHGMVLDEKSQKMSKSKGNVINPMDMVAKYGSDALRLGLVASRSPGQNQAFGEDRVIAGRNFCNKLWNIARFIEGKLGESYIPGEPKAVTLADHWITRELSEASKAIEKGLLTYRFAEASESAYHAVWDVVADWYIEASKSQDNPDMLAWVLSTCLKLSHPFAPFVTETIWQTLSWHDTILAQESWPEAIAYDDIAAAEFTRVQELVTEIRFVTTGLPGNHKYVLTHHGDSLIEDNKQLVAKLAPVTGVLEQESPEGVRLAVHGCEAWLSVPSDILDEHRVSLEARLASTRKEAEVLELRLRNKGYVDKAPPSLVEESARQLEEKKVLIEKLVSELGLL
ncbi:valine--tRNA ligase [Candidatus Saccharibacteria bacterium]|nr:valine--tRNA ligase [Candidatus Saccharibacteria bacterium]